MSASEPAHVRMPRCRLAEILLRARVNALAVAIDRDDRRSPPRPAIPDWARRHPAAPAGRAVQELGLATDGRDARLAELERLPDGPARDAAERQLRALDRRLERLRAEAALERDAGRRAATGPHVLRVPALVIEALDAPNPVRRSPETLLAPVLPPEWQALRAWRHAAGGRPRDPRHPVYRHRDRGPLELRAGLEGPAGILRAVVRRAAGEPFSIGKLA